MSATVPQPARKHVDLWTDGSCFPNPGPGGWAFVLVYGESSKESSGFDADTSNNRMELQAVIEGLNALTQACDVTIYSDSQWTLKCAKREWRRKANTDLWPLFDAAAAPHSLRWEWIKGHAGHTLNERCDQLAAAARVAGVAAQKGVA